MLKTTMKLISASTLAFMMSGCYANLAEFGYPTPGLLFNGSQQAIAVGGGSGTKRGEACASSIFGLIAFGDGSIDTAKSNGGIQQVATVDQQVLNILGLYRSACTVVKGQ
jgi:hypothetical protein